MPAKNRDQRGVYDSGELPEVVKPKKKSKAGLIFLRVMEVMAIGLSYFQGNAIVRFLTTKVVMDATVEVTARFGRDAGHMVATVMAAVVAEPRLIALGVTILILTANGIAYIIRGISGASARRKARRLAMEKRLERKQAVTKQIELKEAERRARAKEEFEAAAMEKRRRALGLADRPEREPTKVNQRRGR